MKDVYKELYQIIWKGIFPDFEPLAEDEFKEIFAKDIILPVEFKCSIGGEPVYSSPEYGYKRFISRTESMKRTEKDNFIETEGEVNNFEQALAKAKEIGLFQGSRSINSDLIEASDDVYSSNMIYNSTHIYSSQKMLFCYNVVQSEYLMASKGSKNCTFSIRAIDSGNVSNSFDVLFSGNTANSYFCHNCFDVRDCIFCFHLASKRFCIANRQFEEAEYNQLKQKILTEYFGQLKTGFKTLRDL